GEESLAAGYTAEASGEAAIAVGSGAIASGFNAQAMGHGASATGVYSVSSGSGAHAGGNHTVAIGGNAQANFDNSTAIGYNAQANAYNSVAIGNGSVATDPNTYSVGSLGNERRITNVAPGVYGTDAVNMDQFNWLDRKVDDNNDKAMAGIAIVSSMATVLPRESKRFAMRVGGGFYGGEEAIGITAAGRINNNISIDAGFGAATGQSEYGGKVGVTYEW
ncbi:MAG: hypothetical protein VR73_06860, partial [Gammaproteobacteria bacterium BRH_c0]